MSINYYPESYQYGTQAVNPMWDYANEYIGADSSSVSAQQWGFGPWFGVPFFRPFPFGRFRHPFFFHRPFWGWGGWW